MKYIIFSIIIIVLLLLLLLLRIGIEISYQKSHNIDELSIFFRLFKNKLTIYKYSGKIFNKSMTSHPSSTFQKYNSYKSAVQEILYYAKKDRSFFDRIDICTVIGTGDAYCTAIVYGLAWSVLSIIMCHLLNDFKISDINLNIISNFDKKVFNINARCIFNVKLAHIILIKLKMLLKNLRKTGDISG